ncbi:MAG: helix-hairpin-helix domain-containing protein [Mucilaginibacter sp.]
MVSYLKTYLSITKKEWNGSVILIILVALILAAPYVNQRLRKDTTINAKAIDDAVAILTRGAGKSTFKYNSTKAAVSGYTAFTKKARLIIPVELNGADSAILTTVYGIGPSFAKRIIKYRALLGGYASKQQLKEVYGLDAEKYAEISEQVTVDAARLKKINVNTADIDELKHLYYLTYKQKNAIIQYRMQHGDYTSAKDMLDIAILDEITINKIKPYIVFK